MLWFTLRKFAAFLATVVLTAWLIHALLAVAPGTPPLAAGFPDWFGHVLIGDFGDTAAGGGSSVGGLIAARLGVTVPLALVAMLMACLIGGGLGLVASRPHGLGGRIATALSAIGVAAPNFWIGMLLVLGFAGGLHLLPPGGFVPWQQNVGGALLSLLLPALAVALPVGCALAIMVRDAFVAARRSAYALADRANGMTEREAFRRDGLPTAGLSVLSSAAPQAVNIVLGTVIVENTFYLPGLGRLILDAVGARDLVLLAGALMTLVLVVCGTALLLRVGSVWADPRRRGRAAS